MTLTEINNLLLYIGIIALAMMFITAPLFAIILSRHFDPYFPEFVHDKNAFERGWWILNPLLRAARYANCMIYKTNYLIDKSSWWKSRGITVYCQHYFGNFDFRVHAKKIDWLIIFFFVGSIIATGVIGLIMSFINYFH